jgi:uncharacterized membrane protein
MTTCMAMVAGLLAAAVQAAPSVAMIDSMFVTGLSADGTVACGNTTDGLYEAARWTAVDGMVRLGRSSVAALGRGAGIPAISADGNTISSTIASSDTFVTQGLWNKGIGWQETMPPTLPDGGLMDEAYGSAWGLSGDGLTVVGLYWRPSASDGTAHASKWDQANGLVDLGSQGHDSRANGANHDGSVVVGWSASTIIQYLWQPTVWDGDGMTVLSATNLWCEAWACNGVGDIVVGDAVDSLSYALPMQSAAMWQRTESGWDEYLLGVLPGTFGSGTGRARGLDVSEDGNVVVGHNAYDSYNMTGFVWTLALGMMKADEFFADQGVVFPEGFSVYEVTAVSDDGTVMGGYGKDPYDFYAPYQSFVVDLDGVTAVSATPRALNVVIRGNHPNPFNPSTNIELAVTKTSTVRLEVFDARGRLVRVIHDGRLDAGNHALRWDGTDVIGQTVSSGTYFARARGEGGTSEAKPMTLVK